MPTWIRERVEDSFVIILIMILRVLERNVVDTKKKWIEITGGGGRQPDKEADVIGVVTWRKWKLQTC